MARQDNGVFMQTSMYMYSDRCHSSLTCLSACHICFLHPKPSPYLSALQCSDQPKRQRDRFILPPSVRSERTPVTLPLQSFHLKIDILREISNGFTNIQGHESFWKQIQFFRNLSGRLVRKRRLQKSITLNLRKLAKFVQKISCSRYSETFSSREKSRKFNEN